MTGVDGGPGALLAERYRLRGLVAVGGMGEVWRAEDTVLARTVAVKVLRPEYVGDDEFRARFRAEARHAAGLAHPGIASVYDFGETAERAWLVMELVDGEPLSALLSRGGALGVDRTLDVVAQTAAALQVAHDGGVVHRDVKPGNLLLRPDGVVKVTDFGIASAGNTAPMTRVGTVIGTAYYLSPEQASGRGAVPASDLYSLGVVAYECLTGGRPFQFDDPVAVALAHLHDAPPPLPDTVPAPVRHLVEQLLAKEPSERPASGAELSRRASALRSGADPGSSTRVLPAVASRAAVISGAATAVATTGVPATGVPATEVPATEVPATEVAATGVPATAVAATPVPATAVAATPVAATGVLGTGAPATLARPQLSRAVPGGTRTGRPRPGSSGGSAGAPPQPHRRAVRAVAVVLLLLALALGLRSLAVDPDRPGTGPGGAQTVTVPTAELLGKPAQQVQDRLTQLGLKPQLVEDGAGQPAGTVNAVDPTGAVPPGSAITVHVVPSPAPVQPPEPGPPAGGDGEKSDDDDKPADPGKGKGRGK